MWIRSDALAQNPSAIGRDMDAARSHPNRAADQQLAIRFGPSTNGTTPKGSVALTDRDLDEHNRAVTHHDLLGNTRSGVRGQHPSYDR